MRCIVVTGMGAVTPLGANVGISWSRLLSGQSGTRRLADNIVSDLPSKIGGVIPSFNEDPEGAFDPDTIMRPKDQRKVDRFISLALAAAEEALALSNWKSISSGNRLRISTAMQVALCDGSGGRSPARQ
ncbi:beta-ketoacyl synthase-like protein [Rhizobium sp. PP-F2F-G20b]|nr:beta-ketoacyl synthase-like protein [Rhizobium sp. PP-F2F-G20b]